MRGRTQGVPSTKRAPMASTSRIAQTSVRGQADPGGTLPPCARRQVGAPALWARRWAPPGTDASIRGHQVGAWKKAGESPRALLHPVLATPGWHQSGTDHPKVTLKWHRSGTRWTQKKHRSGTKVAPMSESGTKVAPSGTEWHRAEKVAPKWHQSGTKVAPIIPKWH